MRNLLKAATLTLILLASCTTKDSETQVTGPTTNPCTFIALMVYTKQFDQELAKEVMRAPLEAVWPNAIRDYRALRKAVQACKS